MLIKCKIGDTEHIQVTKGNTIGETDHICVTRC